MNISCPRRSQSEPFWRMNEKDCSYVIHSLLAGEKSVFFGLGFVGFRRQSHFKQLPFMCVPKAGPEKPQTIPKERPLVSSPRAPAAFGSAAFGHSRPSGQQPSDTRGLRVSSLRAPAAFGSAAFGHSRPSSQQRPPRQHTGSVSHPQGFVSMSVRLCTSSLNCVRSRATNSESVQES